MLFKQESTGKLVDVVDIQSLMNPFHDDIAGQLQWGEDLSDPEIIPKADLRFLSGEALPSCWINSHYREYEKSANRFKSVEAASYYGA